MRVHLLDIHLTMSQILIVKSHLRHGARLEQKNRELDTEKELTRDLRKLTRTHFEVLYYNVCPILG